jgi:AcrR family transcriptional regulator
MKKQAAAVKAAGDEKQEGRLQPDARQSAKRLPKAERREQLLETAMRIVREHGADALTLGFLAEEAGVSKPVTYEHFGTRSGLLIELYRRIDARQAQALADAVAGAPQRLEDVARIVSVAYMTCHTSAGPEWHMISAALKGSAEMDAVQQDLMDGCARLFRDALAPFSAMPPDLLQLRCIGIIGAAEALSQEMTRGRIDEATAVANLAALIVNGIDARPKAKRPGIGKR